MLYQRVAVTGDWAQLQQVLIKLWINGIESMAATAGAPRLSDPNSMSRR
jgi:phosphoglycerate-specific signal transduction histidine kinase